MVSTALDLGLAAFGLGIGILGLGNDILDRESNLCTLSLYLLALVTSLNRPFGAFRRRKRGLGGGGLLKGG